MKTPSFIRVEADEVQYALHILLRWIFSQILLENKHSQRIQGEDSLQEQDSADCSQQECIKIMNWLEKLHDSFRNLQDPIAYS